MRRTIEHLAQTRRDKEDEFSKKTQDFKDRAATLDPAALAGAVVELLELQNQIADARDKEWDALGSNHVGMIFKSMEWRVDKLAAAYEDVQVLLKTFGALKGRLERLLALLEEKKMPAPADVKTVLGPIEDSRYAAFETRFRGPEDAVVRQQAKHVVHFRPGGKVLDLGCGRGEFLDLLKKNGIDGFGVDGNEAMIGLCRDKGLACEKGDILAKLAERPDGSLDGVFSSQVIEHLPPAALQRLVETAFAKLAPGGVLFLETVNPLSVFALVQTYFLDMTHQHPVHPQALKFLMDSAGFAEVEVVYSPDLPDSRLQNLPGADATASLLNRNIDRLNDLLFGALTYAALGRKK
jgi:SAM-dependent methyltransferase